MGLPGFISVATIDTCPRFADESVGEVTLSRRREPSFASRVPGSVRDDVSDIETEKLSRGMALLLAARDRTLTLSEQRVRRLDCYLLSTISRITRCDGRS